MRRNPPTLSITPQVAVALTGALAAALLVIAPADGRATGVVTAAAPAVVAEMTCQDGLLVAVPGGGEGGADDPGSTLRALTSPLVAAATAKGRTVTTRVVHTQTVSSGALRGRGTKRTEAAKAVTREAWRTWRAPVPGLVAGLRTVFGETLPSCPDQLVYLVGYSQGAEAAHRYLASRAGDDLRQRTAAVVLVGDPTRVPGSAGPITGDPRAARKAEGVSARLARTPLAAVPAADWHGPIHSVCTAGDVGCDLGPTRFGVAQRIHASYATTAASRLRDLGSRYGARIALWPRPEVDQEVDGTVGMPLLDERLRVTVAPQARQDLRFRASSPLPPGLSVTGRGALTGTPTRAGSFELAYTVRNGAGPSVSRPMSGRVTVDIEAASPTEVSSGGRHTCEIRARGTLWCWGANDYGQLGSGDAGGGTAPRQVGTQDDWAEVSAGGMHTCGIRDNGTLWCWGLNYRGQVGIGNRKDQAQPRRVGDARDWESVSAGWVHTCATSLDGAAWCWGDNDHGQLGAGNQTDSSTPVAVGRGLVWEEVNAGGWHTCGTTRGGAAYCWGRNIKGQVGDGTQTLRVRPTQVGQATDWLSIQPAWTHTCGLRAGGALSCWGGNEGGQLGAGGFGGTTSPQPLGGDQLWSAVETGVNFSCALDADRALWCWGTGRFGALVHSERSSVPVKLFDGTTWTRIDLGWLFGCGLTGTSPTPSCWGANETGEHGTPAPAPGAQAARAGGFAFNLVSFNVLGSNHTSPRTDAGEFSPARIRTEWMIDYLRSIRASVVGFQEIQRDQLGWFTSGAPAYDVWPGTSRQGDGLQTTIAWQKAVWRLVETDLVTIPFITQTRAMPLVKLEHRTTGRHIWVMNIHNAPQHYQEQRNVAVRREIDRLKKVTGTGVPVFLVGDFNERQRAFCEVTGELDLVAPRGGSHEGGTCRPPSNGLVRIDWIFGSKDVDYSGYTEDKSSLVQLITDHAVLRTHVSVP
ncbi:MAG: RCC1 domain-containing protein [Nocardioides sp.]